MERLLGKQYNPSLAEALVKAEILNTDGVQSIESFSVGFVKDVRNLRIRDVEVMTVYNERANL